MNIKTSIIILGLTFAGCSESKPTENVLIQEQEVVFNLFNVDQVRGSLAYVEEVGYCFFALGYFYCELGSWGLGAYPVWWFL